MSFEVFEGSIEDVPLTAALFVTTMKKDKQWAMLMKDVKVADWLAWQEEIFKLRWTLPDKRIFFAREVTTRKVVGYTALGSPGTFTQEEIDASNGAPPLPEGINLPLMKEMFSVIGMSSKYGYDPAVHYHRKGIVVLPEYQRRGIATMLSQHLNDIVNEQGGTTYVITTQIAKLLFEKQGFEILGMESVGTQGSGNNVTIQDYVMRREPHAKGVTGAES